MSGVGLALERTAVGDRYVLERMVEKGYNVGGEQSGHMILTDYSTTGDGLVAAMQVLATIKRQGKPASEVCRRFEPLPQLLRNVRFSGGRPLESRQCRAHDQGGASERLGDTGRLVIRASGTEPVIRVMAEAEDSGAGRHAGRRNLRSGAQGCGLRRTPWAGGAGVLCSTAASQNWREACEKGASGCDLGLAPAEIPRYSCRTSSTTERR